jgi:hypothetical protein
VGQFGAGRANHSFLIHLPSYSRNVTYTSVVGNALRQIRLPKQIGTMRQIRKTVFACLLLTTLLTSCKGYYNDTMDWMDNIKPGTTLKDVKRDQPDFVKINWDKPDTVDNQVRFWVTEIKGSNDILGMSHLLVFVEDKYTGRESHK